MRLVISRSRKTLTATILPNPALCALGIQLSAAAEPQIEKAIQDGKALFVHETFGGNGMTCDACHASGLFGKSDIVFGKQAAHSHPG
jgi:thiosulfate dehydrogenase